MKTLRREEASKLFDQWWNELQEEWFKLEVLQDYSAEDAGSSLDAWLAGDRERSIQLMKEGADNSWVKSCQAKTKAGARLIRVHIIAEPPTPYLEWELEHYRQVNMPLCREEVYVVQKSELSDIYLPAGDLMIFDNKKAVVNVYNEDGYMTEQSFYEGKDIQPFLSLKEVTTTIGKPFNNFNKITS